MKSKDKMQELTVNSNLTDIDKVRDFLKVSLGDLRLSEEDYFAIELSLLEIYTNIVRYAYPEKKDKIFLKIWRKDQKLFFEIRDNGIPFDPTEVREPDIDKIIATEKVGGFGILISRTLMDGFNYKREKSQNVLILYKTVSI
jgi:anti-sigma regulatory factor (Ser/Thr protein kinase)